MHQAGAARVRFPHVTDAAAPEAVLLNTAGGLTGGDRIDIAVTLASGTAATVTSAAAEKIYRARDGEAAIRIKLDVGAEARLAWLPQPTIVFDRSRLDRRTDVELADDASFLAVEALVFGRAAMGEDVRRGAIRDVWRVRRAGALIFADTFLVDGAVADALDRPATFDGARAAGMLLYAAPGAAARVGEVRAVLEAAGSPGGASAFNGMLVARVLANDSRGLQATLVRLIAQLSGRPLPRVWQC
jgi:urease accessory protein